MKHSARAESGGNGRGRGAGRTPVGLRHSVQVSGPGHSGELGAEDVETVPCLVTGAWGGQETKGLTAEGRTCPLCPLLWSECFCFPHHILTPGWY